MCVSVHLPDLGPFLNEPIHQILTLLTLHNHDLNASLLQIGFATKEGLVLSNDNTRDSVENARTSTFVVITCEHIKSAVSYHISQGDRVVNIVAPLYAYQDMSVSMCIAKTCPEQKKITVAVLRSWWNELADAGSRPEFSNAAVSP
jgi:hypothetical protein